MGFSGVLELPIPRTVGSTDDLRARADAIRAELSRAVLDQPDAIEVILASVIAGGHVLLDDQPGVGKTTLARAIATVFGLEMSRVQGTTDLLPTDITGVHVYDQRTGEWRFRPGPVLASMVLIDELNRATPKAQSALLEAMAEGQVTIDGQTFAVPHPQVVIATQNPIGEVGTHRLAHAQLDRFAICIRLGLPGRAAERALLDRPTPVDVTPMATPADLLAMRNAAAHLLVADNVKDHLLDVVDGLRAMAPGVWLSARVPRTVLDVARGLALLDDRDYVAPDDLRLSLPAVIGHRLPLGTLWSDAQHVIDQFAVPA